MRALPLVALLLACHSGKVALDFDDLDDAQDIREACDEHADEVETASYEIVFQAADQACPWGEDGNLEPEDAVLTARVEQVESLDVGDDAVVCDMEMTFAGEAGLEQDIVYDDNFLFNFNGVVLAASYRPWVEALETDGTFRFYDWDRIAGLANLFDDSIPTYCAGEEAGLSECDIPPPETTGPIRLSFDTDITSELSYRAIEEGRYEFTFVATGDNDPATDCSHKVFWFLVEVPYLAL